MHSLTSLTLTAALIFSAALFSARTSASDLPRAFLPPSTVLKKTDGFAHAEQNGMVYNIPLAPAASQTISLAGTWSKKRMDMDHFASISERGADTMRILEAEGGHTPDPGPDGWSETQIPSVENMAPDDKYIGGAWYRRKVFIPAAFAAGKRVRIIFFSANYTTDVWVNGKWAGVHEGGFTSFAFDVTNLITPGAENLIAVRVDNIPWWKDTIGYKNGDTTANPATYITPYKPCDWWNYSGIYRDVFLYADGPSRIEDVAINFGSSTHSDNFFYPEVLLTGVTEGSLKLEIFNTDINEKNIAAYDPRAIMGARMYSYERIIPRGHAGLRHMWAEDTIPGAKRWTPDEPNLYILKITLLDKNGATLDERVMQLAFRTVEISRQKPAFLLNGAPLFLNGVNRHDELPGRGRAMDMSSTAALYDDLARIKSLGANFVRMAHYPNHPAVPMLAERIGLLTAEEIPVYWFEEDGFAIQNKRGAATAMMLEMIARNRNFPSIAFWSMGNETVGMSEGKKFFEQTYEQAKTLDPARPVYHVMSYVTPWDPSIGVGDFVSMNIYLGVFDKKDQRKDTARFIKIMAKRHPRKPLLISEFGIGADRGKPETEERQMRVFTDYNETARAHPGVMGLAWWAFYQYKGIGGWDSWGLCSFDRSYCHTPAADAMKKAYTGK